MINFFSKIRKQLLSENKVSKYILYAIGEIALVVIGILIALQVNNWNEERKNKEVENTLLKELIIGLKNDLFSLDINLGIHKGGAKACGIILESISKARPYNDSLSMYFAMTYNYTVFAPNVGAYETLKSLGLGIVKNDEIRLNTIKLYEELHPILQVNLGYMNGNVMELRSNFNPSHFEEFHLFDFKNMNVDIGTYGGNMVPINFEELKTNQVYKYHLKSLKRGHELLVWFNSNLREQTESLIELIETETKLKEK